MGERHRHQAARTGVESFDAYPQSPSRGHSCYGYSCTVSRTPGRTDAHNRYSGSEDMTDQVPPNTYSVLPSRLARLAIVLAFAAGATDAFAFLQLSGVFTANMTGNLVLAGLTERSGYANSIGGIIVAILVFVAVLYAAFRVASVGCKRVRLVGVLAGALVAQGALLIAWVLLPDTKGPAVIALLIGLSAIAMACQTAVAKRVDVRSGVTTTYVTGTLTSIMADAADRKPQELSTRVGVIVALVLGALCGSLLVGIAPVLGAALPILPAGAGVGLLAAFRSEAVEPAVTR